MNMLKFPVANPRVHANAMICPSGCHDGLDASPFAGSQPLDVRPVHIHPVNLLRTRAAGDEHHLIARSSD